MPIVGHVWDELDPHCHVLWDCLVDGGAVGLGYALELEDGRWKWRTDEGEGVERSLDEAKYMAEESLW